MSSARRNFAPDVLGLVAATVDSRMACARQGPSPMVDLRPAARIVGNRRQFRGAGAFAPSDFRKLSDGIGFVVVAMGHVKEGTPRSSPTSSQGEAREIFTSK